MKTLFYTLFGLMVLTLTACSESGNYTDPDFVLRYGSSFGECIGDCYQEISINEHEVVLRVRENKPGKQTKLEVRAKEKLSLQEFQDIIALVDEETILALPETIGCPDCADGGAEWVEIQKPELSKKVTFEYRNAPDSLQTLVQELRTLHNSIYESQAN